MAQKNFHVVTIGLHSFKQDLFIQFPNGSRSPCEIEINGTLFFDECLPDHISIHPDKRTHYKARKKGATVYRDQNTLADHPLKLPISGWMPIFVHSIYQNKHLSNVGLKQIPTPKSLHFDLGEIDRFSILIFTKANNFHPALIFKSECLKKLQLVSNPIVILNAFLYQDQQESWVNGKKNGVDLVISVCRQTLPRLASVFSKERDERGFATSASMLAPLPEQLLDLQ